MYKKFLRILSLKNAHTIRFSTDLPKESPSRLLDKAGTTVLLLHSGEPRTNYYARIYLSNILRHPALPVWLSNLSANLYFNAFQLPKRCVADAVNHPYPPDLLRELRSQLEQCVSRLLPEFGPVRCVAAFNQEEPGIESHLQQALRLGMDNLIVISLLPLHQTMRIRPMFSTIERWISKRTSKLPFTEVGPQRVGEFCARNSPNTFSMCIVDRLASAEGFAQYWAARLVPKFDEYRTIIFTAPYPLFGHRRFAGEFEEVARRIMYIAFRQSPRIVSWRISFYASWDQPLGGVLNAIGGRSIANCVSRLRRNGNPAPYLVVPLCALFEDFDTTTTIPHIIRAIPGGGVDLMLPTRNDKAFTHSLAEVIKHAMLNPEQFAQT